MSIVVDILLILVFIYFLIFFTKYGVDRALDKIGKTWLEIGCALIIVPLISTFLEDLFISRMVTDAVYNTLAEQIANNANGYNLAQLFENLPQNLVNLLDSLGASLSALEAEFGSYTEASSTIVRTMAERIAAPCVGAISAILGFIIGLLIPWLFMKWISFEIKKDESHPFFRFFDHVGGFLVGIAAGYAVVLGLSVLTKTIFQVVVAFDAGVNIMYIYDESYVFKFLNEVDTFGVIRDLIGTVSTAIDGLT